MARLPILPELHVASAGPTDPELLTLKAYRILQTNAVIFCDNLANQELLALAPTACEGIYIGNKTYGEYTLWEVN